ALPADDLPTADLPAAGLPASDLPVDDLATEPDTGDAAIEVGGAEGLDAWEAPIAAYDDPMLTHGDVPETADDASDWATFTDEHYIRSSTSDYQGLAEELAARVGTDPDVAPSAVAAGMPGIETGVVGLDDVVDGPAAGDEPGDDEPADDTARTPTDLGLRVLTGIGLVAVFAAALFYRNGLVILATVLFGLAAGEFYAVLVRVGRHPLSLFGLVGVVGGLGGTALWGLGAIPIAITATLVAVALYYALSSPRPDPLTDGGLTVLVVTWALLGAFVFPIIDSPDWRWWIVAVVVVVVAMDIGQFFIGRRFGSRPLAPVVSPHKTVEGYLGGAVVALAAAAVLGFFEPLTLPGTITLALATVVLAPLGDLSVSLLKRIIGVKDMGTILPGHGGILDRVDGLLFVIPAAWVILESMGLLT
ncbi:MAG: phosphatidate cytidylyltransferase, partial [Actinomycetota bacterium]|nr:phosphatidate cytidylyltransferase [Actinomycetota bacterium]